MDCIFCKILSGKIPSERVYEDDRVIVIRDIAPVAPLHLLIITREHIISAAELTDRHAELTAHIFTTVIPALARDMASEGGFRVVSNAGPDAGQSVPHLHLHFVGGRTLGPVG